MRVQAGNDCVSACNEVACGQIRTPDVAMDVHQQRSQNSQHSLWPSYSTMEKFTKACSSAVAAARSKLQPSSSKQQPRSVLSAVDAVKSTLLDQNQQSKITTVLTDKILELPLNVVSFAKKAVDEGLQAARSAGSATAGAVGGKLSDAAAAAGQAIAAPSVAAQKRVRGMIYFAVGAAALVAFAYGAGSAAPGALAKYLASRAASHVQATGVTRDSQGNGAKQDNME